MPEARHIVIAVALAGCGIVACNNDSNGPNYDPVLPTAWAASVTNPWFPLTPGTILEYELDTDEGLEQTRVEVLDITRMVNGVEATVVHDQVFLDGELAEDTFDWYAQDSDGNVWYLGEDTKELEGGQVVSTEGSWEWGVDGALPGVLMWADPAAHLDEEYRQEYARGEAEDWGMVVATGVAVSVPFGDYTGCLHTEDWNALELGAREQKFYCPGVGFVLEQDEAGNDGEALVAITAP